MTHVKLTCRNQTLKPSAKDLLCLLYDQCITSPSQVIERLEFEVALVSQPDGTEADVVDSDTENAFILRLTRYLRGKGHPNHPLISECVPESERNSQEGSTTFRAVQLLLSVSGNCCLPIDPTQKIIVCPDSLLTRVQASYQY